MKVGDGYYSIEENGLYVDIRKCEDGFYCKNGV